MKFAWLGSIVSTVASYAVLETTAVKPSTSPGSATRRIMVLPSADVVESLARPVHKINIPRGGCPSRHSIAPLGYTAVALMDCNASSASLGKLQKSLSSRSEHFKQSSMIWKLNDVPIAAPLSNIHSINYFPQSHSYVICVTGLTCMRNSWSMHVFLRAFSNINDWNVSCLKSRPFPPANEVE